MNPNSQFYLDDNISQEKAIARIPFRVIGDMPDRNQPLTLGLPLPAGLVDLATRCCIVGDAGRVSSVQHASTTLWPDGSVKWLQMQFSGDQLCSLNKTPGTRSFFACCWSSPEISKPENLRASLQAEAKVRVQQNEMETLISTGSGLFLLTLGKNLFKSIVIDDQELLGRSGCQLVCQDARARVHNFNVESIETEESGPLRATLVVSGRLGRTGLRVSARISFHAGSQLLRIQLSVENPQRALHRGGYWDLGDPGSVLVKQFALTLDTNLDESRSVFWRDCPDAPIECCPGDQFEIYQDSSGGEQWQSRSHLNRHGQIPNSFRGYRVRSNKHESEGDRASPMVAMVAGDRYVACAIEDFWQKAPTAIEVCGQQLQVQLWPPQFSDLHELQGGERNTRVVWLDLGRGNAEPFGNLSWVYSPAMAVVDAKWIAESEAIPFFPSPEDENDSRLQSILHSALDGPQSFFAKRETVDEYGWRNFGDMWADHEQAFAVDPNPIISHYNNQYDLLHGMLIQFLRTGDMRWWHLADPLARHVMDIDIYHANHDKSAYSGGLFWHTAHYHAAATCSHRSYSVQMQGKSIAAPGGGPSNEHNYSSGILLYHQLTGNAQARDAVIGLADWVLAMDDGRQHLLGLVSGVSTGMATCTRDLAFQGPGRGAGNSIVSLVNAWLASGQARYLAYAIELIRRTIHPLDDVPNRHLLDVENHWSYTVYLQSLVYFMEATEMTPGCSTIRMYARDSLLQYASWMLVNERLYLDQPEELEYPTETWAAQDLRKGVVLRMAASLNEENEQGEAFAKKGKEILDKAWNSLMLFSSRNCSRPVAIVLQQCYLQQYFQNTIQHNWNIANEVKTQLDSTEPSKFIPQKLLIRKQLRSPRELAKWVRQLADARLWSSAYHRTWTAALFRNSWFLYK